MSDFDYKKYLESNPLLENVGLSDIKDQGEKDGASAVTRDINMFGPPKLKSVVEIQTYVEAFKDGVEEEGRRISSNMKAAMRGGGDEESLSKLIGLKEIKVGDKVLDKIFDFFKHDLFDDLKLSHGQALKLTNLIEDLIEDLIDKKKPLTEDKGDEDEDAYERRLGLEEQLNPEVQRTVNNLIKAMAKKYGYEEKDAVFAIQAALKQREFDNK